MRICVTLYSLWALFTIALCGVIPPTPPPTPMGPEGPLEPIGEPGQVVENMPDQASMNKTLAEVASKITAGSFARRKSAKSIRGAFTKAVVTRFAREYPIGNLIIDKNWPPKFLAVPRTVQSTSIRIHFHGWESGDTQGYYHVLWWPIGERASYKHSGDGGWDNWAYSGCVDNPLSSGTLQIC